MYFRLKSFVRYSFLSLSLSSFIFPKPVLEDHIDSHWFRSCPFWALMTSPPEAIHLIVLHANGDRLGLWISNELITPDWALTMHCLNNADTWEWAPRNVSEHVSCKINLWSPWGFPIPLDQWSQEKAFRLIANNILWLSWECKEKRWCFHTAFQEEIFQKGKPTHQREQVKFGELCVHWMPIWVLYQLHFAFCFKR